MFSFKNKLFKISFTIIASFTIFCTLLIGSSHLLIPNRFTNPKFDHSHFRLQYVFRGQAENFGTPRYQVDYVKDICNASLTDSPIHFHDNKDQIVHLHWQNITGGDVLKFYGINKTGGLDNFMGIKLDNLFQSPPKITPIPIHSQSLPAPAGEDKYFVYIGDKDKIERKDFNQFINQSLEEFLGQNSEIRKQFEEVQKEQKSSFMSDAFGSVVIKAHAGAEHSTITEEQQHEIDLKKTEAENKGIEERNNQIKINDNNNPAAIIDTSIKTEEELKQINNLLGNVVIFVQPNEPIQEQIQARFNNLEPLGLSTCGG